MQEPQWTGRVAGMAAAPQPDQLGEVLGVAHGGDDVSPGARRDHLQRHRDRLLLARDPAVGVEGGQVHRPGRAGHYPGGGLDQAQRRVLLEYLGWQ